MDAFTAAGRARNRLRGALTDRRLKWAGILAGLAYALFYLFTLGHLVLQPGATPLPHAGPFAVVGLENLWRERAPYNFEPIAVFQPLEGFAVFLAVPNLLLAAALAVLLAVNVAVGLYLYTEFKACGLAGSASGFLASVPAFLTGFACCAPSFVIFLGAVSAASFAVYVQVFMPAAFAALIGILGWNLLRGVPGSETPPEQAAKG